MQRIIINNCSGLILAAALVGCGGDDGGAEATAGETEVGDGDGDPSGDGDGDPSGDGDGDGDPGDGDGDSESACAWQWEVTEMKANGQTHAAFDVAVAPDGKIAAVGKLENADDDAWMALFDADGVRLWEQVVDAGAGADAAVGVTFDNAGDLVVIGRNATASNQEIWIEKRSAATGAASWTVFEISNFAGDNEPGDIALAADGDVVVSGTIRTGDKDADIWVRKLAVADGSEQWTSTHTGVVDESGFSIDRGGPLGIASDGSIYVGGDEGVDFETKEAILIKYSPAGAQDWQIAPKATGLPHLQDVVAVAGGPEGEAYFVSYQANPIWSFWLNRVSPEGEIEWELTHEDFLFAPTDDWIVAGLALADDGSLTIGGRLTNEEVGQAISWSEAWIANVTRDGSGECIASHTWQNTHIIPARTYGYGVAEGPNGAVVVGEIVDGPENYLWIGGFK